MSEQHVMDANINIDQLRRKHKTELVERAIRIYQPDQSDQWIKSHWIERLINGHDVCELIEQLKTGRLAPQSNRPSVAISTSAIGYIRVIDDNLSFHAGLKRKLNVWLKNTSECTFQTTPEEPVFIAYHWYRAGGEEYELDGARTSLPEPVEPGAHIELPINLRPPAEPGNYELMVTMVHEGRCWMEDTGLDVQRIACHVQDYDAREMSRHGISVFKQLKAAEAEVIH